MLPRKHLRETLLLDLTGKNHESRNYDEVTDRLEEAIEREERATDQGILHSMKL